jgi:hypothetical protein
MIKKYMEISGGLIALADFLEPARTKRARQKGGLTSTRLNEKIWPCSVRELRGIK